MKKISLKLKIIIWYTLILTILSAIVLFAVSSVGKDMVNKELSKRLEKAVNDITMEMTTRFGHFKPIPRFRLYNTGVHMVIFDDKGKTIIGNIPFGITEDMDFIDNEIRNMKYDGNEYLILDRKVYIKDFEHHLWVKGIISKTEESNALNSGIKNNLIITVILIAIAAVGGYFILHRSFIKVNQIRQTAIDISQSNDLSRRINIGKGNDEIYELANTFDMMFERLEQNFEKEKQFTSDASHELRTPVAVILSECEYINECAKTEDEYKESVSSINRQAMKMKKLITELLMISRMDNNTLKTSFEITDLSELLNFICDEQEEIQENNVKLERYIEDNVNCTVDRTLITRMFINLISNAYQYSNENGTIKVYLKNDRDKIIFIVQDNGIGIKRENLSKIFERFYQENSSRTSDDKSSSGLGLSMVKWIVEYHKGSISVESEKTKGSIFTVSLPKK